MARLRSPVALSEAYTASSTSSSRPAKRPSAARICSNASSPLARTDQPGAGDRAGIDHRIERMVVGVEPDRVEGIARRFDADRAFHPAAPSVSSASANTNGFDIDWMVKGTRLSPTS